MNPKCESSSVFPYGPHPNNRIALPPPKPSPVPSVPGYIYMAFRKRLSRWESDFQDVRLLQDPDPFCLSVLSFQSTPYWKHNFSLSLSSPLLLGNRGPLFVPWAMAWKCQQLGMWDAGQAGTNHRKSAWVGDWLRAEIDIQEEDRRRLKWVTLSTPNSRIIKRSCVMLENHLVHAAQGSSWSCCWRGRNHMKMFLSLGRDS